jgi:hypothetical protein
MLIKMCLSVFAFSCDGEMIMQSRMRPATSLYTSSPRCSIPLLDLSPFVFFYVISASGRRERERSAKLFSVRRANINKNIIRVVVPRLLSLSTGAANDLVEGAICSILGNFNFILVDLKTIAACTISLALRAAFASLFLF